MLDRTIAYDNDSRPVTVTQGSATVTYLYGPDGERLKKLTSSGTTLYLSEAEKDPAGGWTTYPASEVKYAAGAQPPFERSSHGLLTSNRSTGAIGPSGRIEVHRDHLTSASPMLLQKRLAN